MPHLIQRLPAPGTVGAAPPTRVPPGLAADVAVSRLLDLYGPRIRALALRLCTNHADADDAVQDTFLQAFRKWNTFRGDADAGTWLYAIAVRSCQRTLRVRRPRHTRIPAASQLMPWNESTVMALAAAPADEESPTERAEAVSLVRTAIARLPRHLRVPLELKEVLGIPVEDVGRALGLTPNTVKTRLHRARLWLRKEMTAATRSRKAPAPIYEKQLCLDLLQAKFDAMDRGGAAHGFIVPQAELCSRCRAVFRELDLVQDACTQLLEARFPPSLRAVILKAIRSRDDAEAAANARPRRGRRPISRSASNRPSARDR